jgi:peroxiredoxin
MDMTTTGGARCGVLAPDFSLRDVARPASAALVRLRALRQRRPAVVALLPGGDAARTERWLRALAARGDDLAYYGSAIFAIADADEARRLLVAVDVTFPILVDEDGATIRAYLGLGASLPALAVVDRYSQLAALLRASGRDAAPDLDAAVRELGFADQQDCACTVPAW